MLPADVDVTQLAGRHLLALPAGVGAEDLALLASARWRRVGLEGQDLTLSRYSVLHRGLDYSAAGLEAAGLPAGLDQAWVTQTLRERGQPPFPGAVDPTGLARAFPDGLPEREEGRVVSFLLAAARRLGGAVRFDSGVVVEPPPEAAIDMTVFSPIWLVPPDLQSLVQKVDPDFRQSAGLSDDQALSHEPPAGPADTLMTRAQRRELLVKLRQGDREALQAAPAQEAYAVEADLGKGGRITVEVSLVEDLPLPIKSLPWVQRGVVAYAIKWIPFDPALLLAEFPPDEHRRRRLAIARELAALARLIQSQIGSEVMDQDGFPVDPADLRRH
ncbi:MAG: hypothetical protein FWD29_06685 [Micrococcales bacterium]|nr:hypothetical protein [Micrococcales bacterium]